MTYISKKEKVFDLPDREESSSTSLVKGSENRFKIFPSGSGTSEDSQKLQQLYGLLNGKESAGIKSSGFKYVPVDVLLSVLTAEKDAYIQELLEKQEKCSCGGGLFKASRFDYGEEDKEALIRKDAEMVALKNRNAVLESELEECRETLRKAMHKLENVESILNENICLNEKLKYADEMIKLLEENKKVLEIELRKRENFYLEESLKHNPESWAQGDQSILQNLCSERDILKHENEMLRKELLRAKSSAQEVDSLKRQSETVLRNLQEMMRENEYFKTKLVAVKKVEKFVDDLKKQAVKLTEKYERESQRANEQMKQLNKWGKELQLLRDEKAELQEKVSELSFIENEYHSLKKKMDQVELVIEENCSLNMKLAQLDKLEKENEQLKSEFEKLKNENVELSDSKIKIDMMERELKTQEDKMRDLTSQLQALSQEYEEHEDCNRLKTELQEKSDILKIKEEELKEIPNLQIKIDELCVNLQKYKDDLELHRKCSEKLQEEVNLYKSKFYELEELLSMSDQHINESYIAMNYEGIFIGGDVEKHENHYSPIPELETMQDTGGDEVEQSNEENQVESNQNRQLADQDLNKLLQRVNDMKELLCQKDERIKVLESELTEIRNNLSNCIKCQSMENHSNKLQCDIIELQEENHKLQTRLSSKLEDETRIERLEQELSRQKKELTCYMELLKENEHKLLAEIESRKSAEDLSKLVKQEAFLSKKEISTRYIMEIENLRNDIDHHKKLSDELRRENILMLQIKNFTETTGKKSLENVLSKLREDIVVLQNLQKSELKSECEALQTEINQLMSEAQALKLSLEEEKKTKILLEKKFNLIGKEISIAKSMTRTAQTQTCPSVDQSLEIKQTLEDIKVLKEENEIFVSEIAILQKQCKDFQEEVTTLHDNMDEMSKNCAAEKKVTSKQKEEINSLNEKIKECEKELYDLKMENENLNKNSGILCEEVIAKEEEVESLRRELIDVKNEMIKLTSQVESAHKKESNKEEEKSKADSMEKENSEDFVIRVEKELEELRSKLENCRTREEKLDLLRSKRDNLIIKVNSFESEVDFLKKKLMECDLMKSELEQLRAERKSLKNLEMIAGNEEKLLSDIFGLREQLKLQQKEIEQARSENTNLKSQLQDLGRLLEDCRETHERIGDGPSKTDVGITASNTAKNELYGNGAGRIESSTSCDKLDTIITIEEFRAEIAKMENKHKHKVYKLKEGHAEKIKKLMEQYEKESSNRNKSYNESLYNIKSYYENDIKKLVERHKLSILRLQNLHEDEVQELNTNYETQMEAMQTLNENVVSDLTSGAVEKDKLTEKFNREIREVESRFQKLLKEKENQHMTEIANLQEDLNRNASDLKEIHKEDIENLTRLYEENMAQIEEKHNRELKKCKKNNAKRTEMMKLKYEDLLNEERKKYEEQLQIMLERLKTGQQGDHAGDEVEFLYMKNKPLPCTEKTSDFNKILQKILSEGLQTLNFDELMLVHCKTCFATENFFKEVNLKMEREVDLIGDGCPHLPLLKEDRKQLLKRIFILEKEMAIKQLETHEAIINMETAEKCRIEELNTLLLSERDKNEELKMLLTNQTRAQTDLKIESYMLDRQASLHETNFIEKVKELEIERAEKRCLEEELQKEKNNSKHLGMLLENERQRFKSQRKKDSEYIEAMRMRLEEALSNEQIMESQLDYEAQFRAKLEFELQTLQRSFNMIMDQPQGVLAFESKMAKDIKNLDRFESEKEENVSKIRNKVKSHKTA